MGYEDYLRHEQRLNEGLIRHALSLANSGAPLRDPVGRMATMAKFLATCGHPAAGIPTVHVGGTSGKGSTAAMIAGILQAAGLSVGLHVSPYLQAAVEKVAINGRYLAPEDFCDLVDWVLPLIAPFQTPDNPASPHGMASVALAFEAFRRARVDVLVCEVGCGGRFDLTSFVEPVVTVVTNIGRDHVAQLGPTLRDIAWHKAGIARPGVPMISGASGEAGDVIEEECRRVGAGCHAVPRHASPLTHNRDLASHAARLAAERLGVALDPTAIDRGIHGARLPGRMEIVREEGPRVVLDGAHNPEKIAVAARAAFQDRRPPLVVVLGLLATKADRALIAALAEWPVSVVVTEPRVYGKPAARAEVAAELCRQAGVTRVEIETVPAQAVARARALAGDHGTVLVVGSFYMLEEIRELFVPKRSVVESGTSWPAT